MLRYRTKLITKQSQFHGYHFLIKVEQTVRQERPINRTLITWCNIICSVYDNDNSTNVINYELPIENDHILSKDFGQMEVIISWISTLFTFVFIILGKCSQATSNAIFFQMVANCLIHVMFKSCTILLCNFHQNHRHPSLSSFTGVN